VALGLIYEDVVVVVVVVVVSAAVIVVFVDVVVDVVVNIVDVDAFVIGSALLLLIEEVLLEC
jgi:hypothetical protein